MRHVPSALAQLGVTPELGDLLAREEGQSGPCEQGRYAAECCTPVKTTYTAA